MPKSEEPKNQDTRILRLQPFKWQMLEKLQRRSRANFGTVHYLSYVLDPRVHGEGLGQRTLRRLCNDAMDLLEKMASEREPAEGDESVGFKVRWNEYVNKENEFAHAEVWVANSIRHAPAFWRENRWIAPELASLGDIVNSYVCQASDCERLWSSCGRSNTRARNRLSIGKLSAIEQVKYHLRK